jgi:hypothetical protein
MMLTKTISGIATAFGCIVAGLFNGCVAPVDDGTAQGGEDTAAAAEASHGVTTLFGQGFAVISSSGVFLAPSVQFGPGTAFSFLFGRNTLPGLGTAGQSYSEVVSLSQGTNTVASVAGLDVTIGSHTAHAIHVDSVSSSVVASCSATFAEDSITQSTVLGLTVDGVSIPLSLGIPNETHIVGDLLIIVSDTTHRPPSPYFPSIAPPPSTVISDGNTVGAIENTGLYIEDLTTHEKLFLGVANAECTDPTHGKGHGHH